VVQSLGREQSNADKFEEATKATEKANIEATKFGAALVPSVETLNSIGLALVVFFGGLMVLGGSLEIGVLVAFALYITRFFEPVEDLIQRYAMLQRAVVSTARIFEILDIQPLLKDRSDAKKPASHFRRDRVQRSRLSLRQRHTRAERRELENQPR